MTAHSFPVEILRRLVEAECARLRRPIAGVRHLSLVIYRFPRALGAEAIGQIMDVFLPRLRGYDVATTWDDSTMVMFHPETDQEQAGIVARRVLGIVEDALLDRGVNPNYVKIAVISLSGEDLDAGDPPGDLVDRAVQSVDRVTPGEIRFTEKITA